MVKTINDLWFESFTTDSTGKVCIRVYNVPFFWNKPAWDYSEFSSNWFLTFYWAAQSRNDLRVPWNQVRPWVSAPDLINFAWSSTLKIYWFDWWALTEEVYFAIQLPHSYAEWTDIYPHVHRTPVNDTAGNVQWSLEYTWANKWAAFSTPTIITTTQSSNQVPWEHQVARFNPIVWTWKIISSMLICRLFRNANNDTYPSDAGFLEFDIHYKQNKLWSLLES